MNPLGAPYTNSIVWHAVGIDQTTTCALPAGQTCPNGLESGNFVELEFAPLRVGPTASDQYQGGTAAFQFMAKLGTNAPNPWGSSEVAWYIGQGTVAAVPEPETYAMMLAGLGLLGFAARRRRAV
jgi:hypothetical protein